MMMMKMMGQDQVKEKPSCQKKSISPPVKKTNFSQIPTHYLPLSLSFHHHHHLFSNRNGICNKKEKKGFRVENWINMGFFHMSSQKSEIGRSVDVMVLQLCTVCLHWQNNHPLFDVYPKTFNQILTEHCSNTNIQYHFFIRFHLLHLHERERHLEQTT